MKKQFFAWKNAKKATSGVQDWEELSAKEFCELQIKIRMGQITPKRYFACIPPAEKGDVYFYFECTYEQFLTSEKERIERLRKMIENQELKEQGLWYDIISIDSTYPDESGDELSLHEMIADPDSLFEEDLINSICLKNALKTLTEDERKLIDTFYLSAEPLTERAYADKNGVSNSTIHSRKIKILRKMKKSFAQI